MIPATIPGTEFKTRSMTPVEACVRKLVGLDEVSGGDQRHQTAAPEGQPSQKVKGHR
jgi:hypothetical protein